MKSISNLTTTQRNMVAASLEIDGRTDVAAGAIFFNEELSYAKGKPFSAKAIEKDFLEKDLAALVASKGLGEVIRVLRDEKPASLADVAKLHTAKQVALREFAIADRAFDVALKAFENAVLQKDLARKTLAWATTAYETAKAEAE